MDKYKLLVLTLFVLLFSIGSVMAENTNDIDVNQTADDVSIDLNQDNYNYDLLKSTSEGTVFDETSDEIVVENWEDLQYYSSLNDKNYVLKLKENTNYYPNDPTDSSNQILFNNNVTIIGASGAYIGDASPNARNITYAAMLVPDNNGVGITVKNVLFKWIGTRYQPDGVFLQMGGNSINYFEDCYFTNISTNLGHSSIVYIKTGDAVVTNCTFINCTTDFGCLSVYNPDDDPTDICLSARMNVTDSYFEGNYARTEPGCINNCGVLIVTNSTFYKNSAFWWAGAIHTHGGANTTIYDSDFIDNFAGWNGGALYTYSYLQIYNSRFIGNNCTTNNGGGAIGACKYLHAPYIHIEDSLFEDNENLCWGLDELSTSGTGRGGAISLMDTGGLEVYNTTFIKNSASIGTAICAIAGGLTSGSPDVRIVGNRFINHTRVGDVLDVRVATGSISEVRDNYFENNSIVFTKLKLTAENPDSSGRVTMHLDAALKNPTSYDADILDKSSYDVYVDGAYRTTVNSRTFTLDLGNGNTAHVYVVPSISNSKSNEVLAGKPKKYIYVSQKNGNDNNDGLTRSNPVKTLNRSIELARATENIVIMDGIFTETDLTIDYNLTIASESGAVIKVTGNAFTITKGDVKFENVLFKDCKYGSSSKTRLIDQTSTGFLILDGCTFENNEYKAHIEANGMVEAENLKVSGCKEGSFLRANSISIKSSLFTNNFVTHSTYKSMLSYKTQTDKFVAENLTFTGNTVYSGCIGVKKNKATITECSFIGNQRYDGTSSPRSSGIYIEDSCTVTVESCKFINNTDTGKYASVIYTSGTLIIRDSILINNSYENDEGVVINGGDTYLKKLVANNNWWGNTPDNLTKPPLKVYPASFQLPNGWDPAKTWLVLNVTSLSNEIELNKEVPVQFMFTQIDNEGNVTGYDGVKMPSFDLTLTAVNGTCSDGKITVENGRALTYFTLTQISSSSLTGTFNGISTTINFQFKKSVPEINISAEDILVGDSADIVVNVESGATGSIILKVGNITQTKTVSNSKATFSIPNLPAGNYTIEANYTGNEVFESIIQTANLSVDKHNSTTTISHGNIEVNNDVVFTITVSNGATGTVDMYVNGVKKATVNVGQTYTIPNISRGDYVVRAVYSGDSYYLTSEDEFAFDVGKFIPTIMVTSPDITYGEDTIVNVTLNNDATGSVTVTIDGKTNTSQLSNGKASVSISGINAGTNKVINVDYSGNRDYKNATATKTYNVGKASLNFTINADNIKLGQDAIVTIQLPPRSGGTLTITGIKSETKTIPLTGLVTVTYSDLAVGTYTVTAQYNGDNYLTTSKSKSFNVSDWDVPQWPNEGYDVKNTEKSPYSSEVNGNVKWVRDIDGTIAGNMAIDSAGNIYINTANVIYSINPNDGSTNWIFNSNDAGIAFSGIAIGRDTILVPKENDKLYFINQTTGVQYHNNIHQGSSAFAPIVDENGNIYVSGEYYGYEPTRVVVIPYKIWQTSTAPVEIEIGKFNITSSPVLFDNNTIVLTTDSNLMGINTLSQSIIWNIPTVSDSNPVVGPGNVIYVISNGHVIGYNVLGSKMCDVEITGTAGKYLSVGINGEVFSINQEGKLFDYSTGSEALIYDFKEPISARLLVGQDDNLYVGSDSGMFYAIDAEGNLLWKVNLNQSVSASPVMDSNGVIYAVSGNRIVALDNAPLKDSKLTAEIKNVTYGQNVTVNIDLDREATGKVSIKIGSLYENEAVVGDGKVSFTIPNLARDNYVAEISYNGDNRFASKTISVKFNVGKIDSAMEVDFNISIKAGEVLQIKVTGLPADAAGTVSVSVDDKSDSSNVLNGKADLSISGLTKGEYEVIVTYSGDVNYNGKTVTKPVSVDYIHKSFTASSSNVNVGQDVKINVSGLPSDANGVVYVNHNNIIYRDSVANGNAQIIIPGLGNGTYGFEVFYVNDTKYSADSQRVQVNVSKITLEFTVFMNDTINVTDDLIVDVSGLPNDATGLVIVSISDLSRNSSVANGKATITLPQNLTDGTYTVNVAYVGDEKYDRINEERTVKISKITPEFTAIVDNINVGDNLVVDVSNLPNDATGQISVSINGITNTSAIKNGASTTVIHQRLANGTYPVEITYSGSYKYNSKKVTKQVNITKITPNMKVIAKNIDIGEDLSMQIILPSDITGEFVDIFINDEEYSSMVIDGNAIATIPGLTNGTYNYTVYYYGNDKYEPDEYESFVEVGKISIDYNVTIKDIYYGESALVTISDLPADASGNFTVIINKKQYSSEASDGKASISIPDLPAKEHTAEVRYFDLKYMADSKYITFNVKKADPEIDIVADDINVGEDLAIKIILPKDAAGNAVVNVGNFSKTLKVVEGVANVIISNLNAGNHTINVNYNGDDKYNPAFSSKNIAVSKDTSLITVPIDVEIVDNSRADITIENVTGNISVIVDGDEIKVLLDKNGKASIDLSKFSGGNHSLVVVYDGNDTYAPSYAVSSFNITKGSAYPIATDFRDITINDDLTVSFVLMDANDNVIANVPVTCNLNGAVSTKNTDSEGAFAIQIKNGDVVDVNYAGNDTFEGTDFKFTYNGPNVPVVLNIASRFNIPGGVITINGYAVDNKAGEEGIYYSTELLDENGKPIKGAFIQFAVNNKIYNRTTDDDGGFAPYKLNMIRAGRYTMAFYFSGDENHTSTFAAVCVDLDKKPITIKASSKSFKASATKKYTVTLSTIVGSSHDGKVHMSPKEVKLTVNGKTYTGKTNNDGKVTFNLKITKKGKYTAKISYEGDVTYESAEKSVKITVK